MTEWWKSEWGRQGSEKGLGAAKSDAGEWMKQGVRQGGRKRSEWGGVSELGGVNKWASEDVGESMSQGVNESRVKEAVSEEGSEWLRERVGQE